MQSSEFAFYAIGDAALKLGIARSNLRYYIDLGRIPAQRASDGSRLLSHDDLEAAREWLAAHEAAKDAARKTRESALRRIKARSARSRTRAA